MSINNERKKKKKRYSNFLPEFEVDLKHVSINISSCTSLYCTNGSTECIYIQSSISVGYTLRGEGLEFVPYTAYTLT
jgi:hypothetical protein